MNGILLVDKPQGFTSQDLVSKVKKLLNIKRIGHAGTLDPLATGLMVLLLGEATKLSDYIMGQDKTYFATISIGKSTNTEDRLGTIVEEKKVTRLSKVDEVLDSFLGPLQQTPPMFSSVHHQGVKLYKLAQQGLEVKRQAREVNIYSIQRKSQISYNNNEAEFSFLTRVSKGTYIRTLCLEIGNRLKFPAHMKELKRTASGQWSLSEAFRLEDIEKNKFSVIPMLDALGDYFIYEVDEVSKIDVLHGKRLYLKNIPEEEELIVIKYNNELLGIYEKDKEYYKARRIWN